MSAHGQSSPRGYHPIGCSQSERIAWDHSPARENQLDWATTPPRPRRVPGPSRWRAPVHVQQGPARREQGVGRGSESPPERARGKRSCNYSINAFNSVCICFRSASFISIQIVESFDRKTSGFPLFSMYPFTYFTDRSANTSMCRAYHGPVSSRRSSTYGPAISHKNIGPWGNNSMKCLRPKPLVAVNPMSFRRRTCESHASRIAGLACMTFRNASVLVFRSGNSPVNLTYSSYISPLSLFAPAAVTASKNRACRDCRTSR